MSNAIFHPGSRPLPPRVPQLQNGDRLTRAEFERWYDATPGLKKAELIEGVVCLPAPVSHDSHSGPDADFGGWLSFYRAVTPGVLAGHNGSLRPSIGPSSPSSRRVRNRTEQP